MFPLSLIERVWYMGVVYPGIKRFVQKIIHLMKLKYCARPWFKNGSRISPKRVTPHFHRFAAWVFKGIKLKRNLWHLGFYLKANWYRWLWNMALFVCCFHFPAITKWNELNALRIRMQRKFYAQKSVSKGKKVHLNPAELWPMKTWTLLTRKFENKLLKYDYWQVMWQLDLRVLYSHNLYCQPIRVRVISELHYN